MDGLKFIEVDNHEAVKVSGLRQGGVEPKFSADFPVAIIRDGAGELTLRAEEEGARRTFIDTTHVKDHRWESPLVDADWHAFCQAMYEIEG